jgi:hypothetical protein
VAYLELRPLESYVCDWRNTPLPVRFKVTLENLPGLASRSVMSGEMAYFGGRSSLLIQPSALLDIIGSSPSAL